MCFPQQKVQALPLAAISELNQHLLRLDRDEAQESEQ